MVTRPDWKKPWCAAPVRLWILLSACLWLSFWAQPVQAAVQAQAPGQQLQGDLPAPGDRHYLALTPDQRDGALVLTMAVDPQDNKELRGRVNFLVLTEDGLRRFLAGADPRTVEIASGNPVPFDPEGNKVRAIFRASGLGSYTVIVINDSEFPASYTLSVQGGVLEDESGQTSGAPAAGAAPAATGVVSPTVAASAPAPTATVSAASPPVEAAQAAAAPAGPPGLVTARRVTGALNSQFARHYLVLEPGARDAPVTLDLVYDPLDRKELIGNLNFWVLTEDGVRRMIRGDNPADLNLATGFQAPFSPFPNELQAQFQATGLGPYTTVVFNNSKVPATYSLDIQGGLLVDQYGQTNESKAAAAELQALGSTAPAAPTEAPAVTASAAPTSTSAEIAVSQPVTGGLVLATAERKPVRGALELTGDLATAYEHDYVGLVPDRVDGRVILTLDFEPLDSQALRENINFWVLTEEALRQVMAGARPVDVNTAVGAPIQFGPEQGKLRGVFTASGQGNYTVIVYNNSDVPAIYKLGVEGGVLSDNSGNTLALTLP